jgi:hypothetical protein
MSPGVQQKDMGHAQFRKGGLGGISEALFQANFSKKKFKILHISSTEGIKKVDPENIKRLCT